MYFLRSRRSGVFFLFLVVMYLEIPGTPVAFCSVHSRMTCTLASFDFFAIIQYFLNKADISFVLSLLESGVQTFLLDGSHSLSGNFQSNEPLLGL